MVRTNGTTLVVIAGPSAGQVFSLTENVASVGRDSSNQLWIADLALSRHHCRIVAEGGHFTIHDLDSSNGTFVNGLPVKERRLEDGDQIKVGDTLLLFVSKTQPARDAAENVNLDSRSIATRPTCRLRFEDAAYLRPNPPVAAVKSPRAERDLHALLRISTVINSIRNRETFYRELLDSVFEVVPAQSGAILLYSADDGQLDAVYGKSGDEGRSVHVSRELVCQVAAERAGVVSGVPLPETPGGDRLPLCSVLCVPLVVYSKSLGVIYLASANPAHPFDKAHLELVTGVAAIAAVTLQNIGHLEELEIGTERLKAELRLEHSMVGESQRMRGVYQAISKIAATDTTVLICGETGTGKELAARAIHENSRRRSGPFVAVNCAALTEALLESELFGHEKGAFTGAVALKRGRLELADGGTLFLDEIGELAQPLQAKLLRVLQERAFERVGGTRAIKVDIRLIAATNRQLDTALANGTFRNDLYFRLNVVSVTMPPLRERVEDVPLLANYFLAKCSKKADRRVTGLSAAARKSLTAYDWPGNVRELENAIERAVVLGSSNQILPEDLPENVFETSSESVDALTKYHEAVKEAKKQLIVNAMTQANGQYTAAARLLGLNPNYLHRLITNMKLRPLLGGRLAGPSAR